MCSDACSQAHAKRPMLCMMEKKVRGIPSRTKMISSANQKSRPGDQNLSKAMTDVKLHEIIHLTVSPTPNLMTSKVQPWIPWPL